MKQIKLKGISVYSSEVIDDKAVIFIHGNSLSALSFINQFDLKFPLVALDLPGHGLSDRSEHPEASYCIPGYIKTLKMVINEMNIKEFVLVGHSLGGHVAIEAADELEGLKGLVFFGTPPIGIPPQMDKMFLPNPLMAFVFQGELKNEEIRSLSLEFAHENPAVSSKLAEIITQADPSVRINLGASIAKGQFKNELEILQKLKVPVAVFHGEKDKLVNSNYFTNVRIERLWNGAVQIIRNTGHTPQLETPIEFNSLLSRFCAEIL